MLAVVCTVLAWLAVATCCAAYSGEPRPAASSATAGAARRPRVGLALSGGGAGGFAHVGVLQVLEEIDFPVDLIAGTSMGSVIGGLRAIGTSPDELAEMATTIDW